MSSLAVADAQAVSARRLGWTLAAVGAVLFSAKAILAKLQFRYGLDALDVMTLRMGLSLPLFVALGVRESRRPGAQPLARRDIGLVLVLGVIGYYLSSLFDFWGLQYVPVSLERLLMFLNPTFVLLIGVLALGRKVARTRMGRDGGQLCWAWRWCSPRTCACEGEHVLLGSGLVLLAALSYALYLVMSGELIGRIGSLRLVAYAMCVSGAAIAVHYLLVRDPAQLLRLPAPALWLGLVNAVLCMFLPVTFTMAAVARIGAGGVAQMSMLGPVSLLFLGSWLLGEAITPLQVVGTAVVLGGVVVLTRPAANSVPMGKEPVVDG